MVHNAILRSINAIYLQCVNVERAPERVGDFVNYCYVWGEMVEEHHRTEETDVFPELEKLLDAPGLMEGNVEQHHAFHDGFEAYRTYVKQVRDGQEKYDGKKLKATIDSFMPVLRQHLYDEIDSLIALEKYDGKVDLSKWWKAKQKEIVSKATDPNIKVRSPISRGLPS
jgi:hemerythrin-like domain-containing protein